MLLFYLYFVNESNFKGLRRMSKDKNMNAEKQTLSRTHVPDKVYAYSLQVRHALYELLNCSVNDLVSIEVFDDVATKKFEGSVEATQLKSVLSDSNPISNRAVDLWKTFYNWLLAVKSGELCCENTIFKLFVTAERNAPLATSFSIANTIEKAEDAWKEARGEFYDENGNEKNLADGYALYIRDFFRDDNMLFACRIIKKFNLITINENHTSMLYKTFCEKIMIPEQLYENAFIFMLGWIEKITAELVESEKAMIIAYNDFKAQLVAITSELNQKQSLKELAPGPTTEEIQSEYSAVRRYVEQLDIINCDYTEKIEAISDYLRASANRTIWASKGYISDNSFDSYEEDLIRVWKNENSIISLIQKNLTHEERGKFLYLKCKEKNINIAHLCVPSFFVPGCYHALSDEMVLGWHPEYEKKFKGDDDNE